MRTIFLLGRAIFGGFFLYNGIHHFQHQQEMSGYAAAKGVAAHDVAIPVSGTLLTAGGLSVLLGSKPRLGLLALLGFLVPVSLSMHRFWDESDPAKRQQEQVQFAKNMALVGAVLMLMQIAEPWPAAIDITSRPRETFPRVSPRELRALRALPA